MSIEKLRHDRMEAFRAGNKLVHSVLTNVVADSEKVGKDKRQGDPTPEEVQAVLKKHADGVEETINYIKDRDPGNLDGLLTLNLELDILTSYRPKQMNEGDLRLQFDVLQPASVKDWMAHLKTHFAGQYDGKLAKKIFDEGKAQ